MGPVGFFEKSRGGLWCRKMAKKGVWSLYWQHGTFVSSKFSGEEQFSTNREYWQVLKEGSGVGLKGSKIIRSYVYDINCLRLMLKEPHRGHLMIVIRAPADKPK